MVFQIFSVEIFTKLLSAIGAAKFNETILPVSLKPQAGFTRVRFLVTAHHSPVWVPLIHIRAFTRRVHGSQAGSRSRRMYLKRYSSALAENVTLFMRKRFSIFVNDLTGWKQSSKWS